MTNSINVYKNNIGTTGIPGCITVEILEHVPVFPRSTLDRMLRHYNLVQVIRFLARLAPLFTDAKVRTALRWSKAALIKHKGVVTRLRTVNNLGTLELSPDMLRFGFLTLAKSSQATFPPRTQSKVFTVENLTLLQTRYDSETMHAIFGSGFLPVISATDSVLIKRLFEASHIRFLLNMRIESIKSTSP